MKPLRGRLGTGRLAALARGPWMLAFGVWLLLLVSNPGRNEVLDVEMRRIVARQMWTARSVTISVIPPHTTNWVPAGPGRWAAPYGVGQSLVFIPFDMVGAVFERLSPETWRERAQWIPIGFGLLPLLGLACWLAMRAFLREWGISGAWPSVGALVMLLATIVFHYAGQGQEEMLVIFCLTLSMLFALRLRRSRAWSDAIKSGALAGACLVIRPVSIFALAIVPFLTLSASNDLKQRLRLLAWTALGLAAVSTLVLWYNFARFGGLFTIGYDRLGHVSKIALNAHSPMIVASLLFGPGVGLLVLSPILLAAIPGFAKLWRGDRWYLAGALVAVISCYLFFSTWHDSYTGGGNWGTRYQVHLLALVVLPLTLGLQRLYAHALWRRLGLAVLVSSLVIQVASVMTTHHMEIIQNECDGLPHTQLCNGVAAGQAERRFTNIAHWIAHQPPAASGSAECRETVGIMWDRYFPNFWGPVYAHRLTRGANLVLAFWAALLLLSLVALFRGLRRELREQGGLEIEPDRSPAGSAPAAQPSLP